MKYRMYLRYSDNSEKNNKDYNGKKKVGKSQKANS